MPSERKKWVVAFTYGVIFFTSAFFYSRIALGPVDTLTHLSVTLAASASLLYAVALSASTFSYYTGWPNLKHGYQKQIGLLAYWLSVLYVFSIAYLYPEIYVYGLVENILTPDIILGATAMFIFTAMTVINAKPVAPYFKFETIKFVLGLGFVAYAMLVMRAVFIEWPLYENWIINPEGLPPGRFVLSVIAMFVLLARLSIPLHLSLTKKN